MKIYKSRHKQITLEEDRYTGSLQRESWVYNKENLKKLITWRQPKYLLADKWIRKLWYTHTDTHTHTHNGILLSH